MKTADRFIVGRGGLVSVAAHGQEREFEAEPDLPLMLEIGSRHAVLATDWPLR